MACIAPCGVIATANPTYQWDHESWATWYEFQVYDGQSAPGSFHGWIDLANPPANFSITNNVVSFIPGSGVAGGYPCTWSIRPWSNSNQNAAWVTRMDFIPTPVGNNSFDTNGCKLYFVSDAPGQSRRVIDINTARNTNNPWTYPKDVWNTFDVSDLVPSGTQAILLQAEFIVTPTEPPSGLTRIGYMTRRNGSSITPSNYNGFTYTTGLRNIATMIVLLGSNRKFDFYWSDGGVSANGLAINASMIGYAAP